MVLTKMVPIILLLFFNLLLASAKNSSLTFVIDDSGSMEDDINQVRKGARDIMNIILQYKSSQIQDIVLVTFNDPVRLNKMKIKTRDPDKLQAELNSIVAHNDQNHDWPEYSLSGIELALQNSQPNSYLFVFTDASAKDYDKVDLIKSMCQKAQTQILFILTDYCSSYSDVACIVYHEIAEACSGQVFIVDKNEIYKVLEYVKETVKGEKTVIKSVQVPRNKWTKVEFTIDDKTEYALVSVAGENVRIANTIGFSTSKVVLSTANTKAYRLDNPTPGVYGFSVLGTSQVSVMIFSRTDFLFDHGFSEMVPKSLSDTSKQPIADEKSYLSISVTDPDHEVVINYVQILDMNDHVLYDLPLTRVSGDFYITQQFVSPNKLFQVAVIGKVKSTGKSIRRLAKTPIEPQKPKIKPIEEKSPVTSISEGSHAQVPYNGKLQLTCTVSAYPAPNIIWTDSKGAVLQSKSSPVELPYKYISYLTLDNVKTNGSTYVCTARNKLSEHKTSVQVVVQSPFTVEVPPPATSGVRYGKNAVLQCKIRSSSRMRIDWFVKINNQRVQLKTSDKLKISSDGTELRIKSVALDSIGQYTCKAVLVEDSSQHLELSTDVEIIDLVVPVLEKINLVKTVKINTPVSIPCKVLRGNPAPTLSWQFKSRGSNKFVPLPGLGKGLQIAHVALSDAGTYRCIAKNIKAEDKVETELIVEAPPTIVLDDGKTVYSAVVGDFVLRVPCNAVGYPIPTITWSRNGKKVVPDKKVLIENDNVLVIKNPVVSDSTSYECKAVNKFGTVTQMFEVGVKEYLFADDTYGDSHEFYIKERESKGIPCNLPHTQEDTIKWYLNGLETKVTGAVYDIRDARQNHDGNYTCRVNSQRGAVSDTYEVDVGYPPQFKHDALDKIDWNGDEAFLDCSVNAKPPAEAKWLYKGEVMKETKPQMAITKWGNFVCELKNPHGTVKRSFTVFSTECLIYTDLKTTHTPLMLSEDSNWPQLESIQNIINVNSGSNLKLSCPNQSGNPNHFKKLLGKSEVIVTCDKEDNFLVDGSIYKFSELACENEVSPVIVKTGTKCLKENSEMIKVGFNLDHFVEAYEVCYDKQLNVPLYAHSKMSTTSSVVSVAARGWFKYPGIGDSRAEQKYTCGEKSECCYSKSQLINARDVSYGPPQQSTFIDHLNSIALWHSCDSKHLTWQSMEESIRLVFEDNKNLSVWSGASKYVTKDGLTIPRYLWKVFKFFDSEPIAAVYINDPQPSHTDILCDNICAEIAPPGLSPDGKPFTDSHVYCCQLGAFANAFELPENIFTRNA